MSLAENITRYQRALGETNYRTAMSIGVTQQSIKNWKHGVRPHPVNLRMLADHFGCTVDELLEIRPKEG